MSRKRVTLSFVPRRHQAEARRWRKRFSVLVWHRRSGKTVFAVMELLLAALGCKREAGRYAYVAPYYRQAKAIAWTYLQRFAREIPGVQVREAELMVILPKGAQVKLFGADNPDSLRGLYFDGVVLDEVADMKPQVWGEIIRPCLADRQGWALFIGTPKGLNLFSELYNHAKEDPEWYADLRRWSDTNALAPEEIEKMRKEMSKAQFDQELECDFSAAVANALIPLDLALAASKRKLGRESYHFAPLVLGVDVARFGDDTSVIFPRQGLAAFAPKSWQKIDTMQFAGLVIQESAEKKADATFVDVCGLGGGVVDRCRQLGHDVVAVDSAASPSSARFKNLRAEMWWKMLDWIKEGGCLPDLPDLVTELCAPTFRYDAANRIVLESKEDMKERGLASPNCFVAGTGILTPRGQVAIELLKEGNEVVTPMGVTRIHKTHRMVATTLTRARFSDGSMLEGKGAHKVFTFDAGWVRLDSLSLTNAIESDRNLWIWRLLSSCCSTDGSFGFKARVDTILGGKRGGERLTRRDFFTDTCGFSAMAQFPVGWRSIIRMAIRAIIPFPIWKLSREARTCVATCLRGSAILSSEVETGGIWRSPRRLPRSGMDRRLELSGTKGTEKPHGQDASRCAPPVRFARRFIKRIFRLAAGFVRSPASGTQRISATKQAGALVRSAVRHLFSTDFGARHAVPVDVQTFDVAGVSVFNLTLEKDNVYFANGILVENCADALAFTFAYPVQKASGPDGAGGVQPAKYRTDNDDPFA